MKYVLVRMLMMSKLLVKGSSFFKALAEAVSPLEKILSYSTLLLAPTLNCQFTVLVVLSSCMDIFCVCDSTLVCLVT